ncbi:hypothetical protein QR680_009018 [Steinernema hermaphroditum]|uniref:Rac GTPase-activating protein 1 n=1 Tax=Steinernema hermaphroditum TaxID=289476 RepID=A0AA39IK74_9BILA|nr:hypothetical protein QR680_009018 [Steinernema hermaphroditum]
MARPNWSLILDLQEAYAANAYCTEFITYLEDELLDLQNGNLIVTKRNAQLQAELSLKNAENEELRRMLEERSQREVEVSSDHQRSSDDHDGISYTDESILGNTGRSLDYMLDHPFSSITMKGRQLSSPFKQNNDCPRMGKLRRSVSESNVIDMRASLEESESEEEEQIKGVFSPSQGRGRFGIASSVTDMRTRVETSPKRDSASFTVDDVQRRPHDFAPKRNFLRDACDVCGKPFGFRSHALKCQCCKVVCHTTCKDGTTFPCAPRSSAVAAKGDPAKYRPRFADFCPPASPMIPHIVIHLVTAMDDCCLHIRNIYRLKASERLIQDLLTQLKVRKSFPQLRSNGPGVLSGCLKRFLLDLKDPIIPISSSSEFAKYASNEVALQQILCELPIPNQETLQFLCLHWQRVIENSDVNRMDSRELAKALAPVVFGNSSVDKADLVNAMEALLELRNWRDLVSYNHNRAPLTPFGSRQKSFKARAGLPPAPNAARWRM